MHNKILYLLFFQFFRAMAVSLVPEIDPSQLTLVKIPKKWKVSYQCKENDGDDKPVHEEKKYSEETLMEVAHESNYNTLQKLQIGDQSLKSKVVMKIQLIKKQQQNVEKYCSLFPR